MISQRMYKYMHAVTPMFPPNYKYYYYCEQYYGHICHVNVG
jgi:hypothetical protein